MRRVESSYRKSLSMPREAILNSEKKNVRARPLSPFRSLTTITETGPKDLPVEEISVEQIGWKAYGLCSLPSEWVPLFFLITVSCFEEAVSDETLNKWVFDCLARIGVDANCRVIVRSSGTSETMRNRGQLMSRSCPPQEIVFTIRNLIAQLSEIPSGRLHWIVQRHIAPKAKGHLSNERRLSREKRDWIVEFEPQENRLGHTAPSAYRRWRDGSDLSNLDLGCTSEPEITLRLKRVVMWSIQFSSRIHFEWVWDGGAVYIVQAQVEEPATGVDPRAHLPTKIHSVKPANLQVFHPANQQDYEHYDKLRNAKLYGELNYHMPLFYLVDQREVIDNVISGHIPSNLENDLVELTKRPLIIRTDGLTIPGDKREMLPRSDELRSYAEARDWLLTNFKSQIEQSRLGDGGLCLIAHHFIPSVASAWARAEPGNRVVRIESLWGIPEGLYWYSHDTFEVDTQVVNIDVGRAPVSPKYRPRQRLRYKGTFIAPNEYGKWIPYQTAPSYSWNSSIAKKRWLFEIAHTTRQVAERERYAVSVMWFIDNHPQATEHKVLPWFHIESELTGTPKAAPRHKRKSASDFSIETLDDWRRLQQHLQSGTRIERVIVKPVDPDLIRNRQFAEELAELAAAEKFVIELYGGILSHAYYLLQRRGAQVECFDLFGAEEDVVEFNKVVRDKIPKLIEERGERVETVQLAGDALVTALKQKLVEEAYETLDAKLGEEIIGELADVEEVIRGLCRALNVDIARIETEREEKLRRRGGFDNGLMLIKTATPHSIQKQPSTTNSSTLKLSLQQSSEAIISNTSELPVKPSYRRPDLRLVNQQLEKLFTFETETNTIGEIKEDLIFSMPIGNQQQGFTLTAELRRIGSSVRGVIRLRLLPSKPPTKLLESQLKLEFPE